MPNPRGAPDPCNSKSRNPRALLQGIDEVAKTAHIRLVTYNVVDSYGSNWQRGVFDESLQSTSTSRQIPGR